MSSRPSSRGRTPRSGRWSRSTLVPTPAARSTVTITSRPDMSTRRTILGRRAVPAHPDPVDRDGERVGVEGRSRRARRGQDPAPVRVLAVDGALEEVAARDGATDLDCCVLVRALTTSIRMSLLAPSASAISWRARSAQTASTALGEVVGSRARRPSARCQQQDGVVGRHAAVGVDAVERLAGGGPQRRRPARWIGDARRS